MRELIQQAVSEDRLKVAGARDAADASAQTVGLGEQLRARPTLEDVGFDSLDVLRRGVGGPVIRQLADRQAGTRRCAHANLLASRQSRMAATARCRATRTATALIPIFSAISGLGRSA